MKLKVANAEQTTDARAIATADKLNAVSVAAAHFLVMPLTSPHLVINADGTSFQTGGGQTELVPVVYDPEMHKENNQPLKVLPEVSESDSVLRQILPLYQRNWFFCTTSLYLCR